MKYRYRIHFSNLWKDSSNSTIKHSMGSQMSCSKKYIDDMCIQADLSDDLSSYLHCICSGMIRMIGLGVTKEQIKKHDLAFSKILHLGDDVINCSEHESDLYYIGLFIEIKTASSWFKLDFYKLIQNFLKKLVKKISMLSNEIKGKILSELKKINSELYELHLAKKNGLNSA